ncbi:YqjF family protein [Halobacillus sp. K22]|uniref:YqjF family protein n=1 Tax=Halobacillus sp. K22 TaxID=3457431 RepID=UPI003FCE3A77
MSPSPWIIHQSWEHLIFMHWPVPEIDLLPFVPNELELDLYNGMAWIAIVPFHMKDIRFRGIPRIPFGNQLLDLNVRTYVTYKGEPGVYFISLDANHSLGVFLARTLFGLPYLNAQVRLDKQGNNLHFSSRRTHPGMPESHFHARFRIFNSFHSFKPGSLMNWLTERYMLWTVHGSSVFKGPIEHKSWQLQPAESDILINGIADFLPELIFHNQPITYFSRSLEVYLYPFQKL